jgi:hypothetical protein
MEQSPSWEANRFATSLEIPRILWNPKVHFRIHKFPLPVCILSQLNPVRTPTPHFLKVRFNVTSTSMSVSTKWCLSLRFYNQNRVYASSLPHTRYMPRPFHSSRFHYTLNSGWGAQIFKFLIMKFSPFPCYLVPLRPKYSPQHLILKHPQLTFLPQRQRPCTLQYFVTSV